MTNTQRLSPRSQAAWNTFQKQVSELGGQVIEASWLGNGKPHRVRCRRGHDCAPRPADVNRGQGLCRICVGHDSSKPEAEFRARLAELGATLIEPRWLGIHKAHRVRCAFGHDCTPRPTSVRRGQGICRTCSRKDPEVAWATFRARIEGLGGVVLEPAWLGNSVPHRVRCAAGHETRPRPHNVQSWGICRTCAGNDTHVAEAAFRERLAEAGATLLETQWLGASEPHRVQCAQGHACTPRPHGVLQGSGVCRMCSGKTWDVFYVVADETDGVVKFGITSGDPRRRLSRHARDGLTTVVRLIERLPDDDAPRLERAVLAALRDAREKPVRGVEYFSAVTLALILDVVDGWTTLKAPRQA